MSITLAIWLIIFVSLSWFALVKKPVWGVSLYIFVFFVFPRLWWWGKSNFLLSIRFSLLASLILLVAVFFFRSNSINSKKTIDQGENGNLKDSTPVFSFSNKGFITTVIIFTIMNHFIVHYILAGGSVISQEQFILSVKYLILFYLIQRSIQSSTDFLIVLLTIILCLGYIGYQVKMNGAGNINEGRLEDIPIAGAMTSNLFASLIVLFLPMCGALFFVMQPKFIKLCFVLLLPFIINLLFLVNSRGAYLGTIAAGFCLVLMSRKREKQIVLKALFLSVIAVFLLAGNQDIFDRFESIFVSSEDRDSSASSRLIFWQSALEMISDYPLGTGGDGFSKVHGLKYTAKYGITKNRAVHNGFLDIACNWGVQGLLLKLLLIYALIVKAYQAANFQLYVQELHKESFLIKSCICGVLGFLVSAVFTTVLDEEWLIWMLAILYSYINLVQNNKFRLTTQIHGLSSQSEGEG